MHDATNIRAIEGKYIELLDDLDERGRRRWAAVEARALGRGGITAVALATGLSDRTIRTGLKELDDPAALAGHRQRRSGGGRKPHALTQPGLQGALDSLIEPTARGSPMNPLRWTIKSTHRLAHALRSQGYEVSATSVRRMLAAMNYSLQGNRKTREGVQHPDRDGQFRHIAERVKARKRRGEPAISVDTKKKEVLGNLKNAGQTYSYRPANYIPVLTHGDRPVHCARGGDGAGDRAASSGRCGRGSVASGGRGGRGQPQRLPAVGEQFGEALGRVRRQAVQHVTQVRERVEAPVLAGRREAEQHRRGSATLVAAQEQPVDPAHADQLQRPFADVVVDVQVAIGRVAIQGLPLIEHVVDRGGDRALGQHLFRCSSSQRRRDVNSGTDFS